MFPFHVHTDITSAKLGWQGEKRTCAYLRKLGLRVKHMPYAGGYDLLAEGHLRVEIKTARLNKDGKYRFTLYRETDSGIKQNHNESDIVILNCIGKDYCVTSFVIPISIISNQHRITISGNVSGYKGKYVSYRENFNLVKDSAKW